MNYIIFDNDIYYDSSGKTGIVPKDKINDVLAGPRNDISVAVIDTLQKQVAAPEKSPSRKDEAVASSFSGDYLIQSERIAANLFQVIAVEKPKAAEIYKLLGFENLRLIVPYGVALREFLKSNEILSQDKRIVFLDHLGNQVLLTIFDNDIFTTPRRLSIATKRVVSELTRSQENYKAQAKDKEEVRFLIVTNSTEIMEEIVSSGLEKKENILCFSDSYPAISGLKQGKFSMHYLLPEQFIRLRKLKIVRKRIYSFGIMGGIFGVLLILLLGSFSMNKNALTHLERSQLQSISDNEALERAYVAKYRDILRHKVKPDLPYFINSFIKALPFEYKIESITISNTYFGPYRFEAIVSQKTRYKPFIKSFLPAAFKQAKFENILVKGNPGVRVILDIL